jgi:hypothetical protein
MYENFRIRQLNRVNNEPMEPEKFIAVRTSCKKVRENFDDTTRKRMFFITKKISFLNHSFHNRLIINTFLFVCRLFEDSQFLFQETRDWRSALKLNPVNFKEYVNKAWYDW